MKTKIKYIFFLTLLPLCLASCLRSNQTRAHLITFNKNGSWGYEILINDKPYVYQEYIPAIEGKIPFTSKRDAEVVGKLVLKKILNKETPTVHTGELILLGIIDAS